MWQVRWYTRIVDKEGVRDIGYDTQRRNSSYHDGTATMNRGCSQCPHLPVQPWPLEGVTNPSYQLHFYHNNIVIIRALSLTFLVYNFSNTNSDTYRDRIYVTNIKMILNCMCFINEKMSVGVGVAVAEFGGSCGSLLFSNAPTSWEGSWRPCL